MDSVNLNSFLKFGYFLDYQNPNYKIDLSGIDKEKYKEISENELIKIGSKLWKEAVQKQFRINEKHVVPLSGGLDSRAILATLLEFTEAKNIYTYTFGTPKTLDYNIGNFVAKKVGTNHTIFPLTEYKYTIEEEIDISKRIDYQTALFHHPPVWELDKRYKDFNIWSGCMGDMLTGIHYPKIIENNIKTAKKNFILSSTYVKSIDITNCDLHELLDLISCNNLNNNLTIEEQLYFQNTGEKFELAHVVFDGLNFKVPFLGKEWVNFILSMDSKYRKEQNLYMKILLMSYPKLFSLPNKTLNGLSLNAHNYQKIIMKFKQRFKRKINTFIPLFANKGINYLDFNNAIRNKIDFKNIIYENIMDLKARKIVDWIDIDGIWKRHINKQVDHADALLVLASLEIHLKAGKEL